jgi:hypothetical protein
MAQVAFADPALNYDIHEDYVSTQGLGMGNAWTAAVNDKTAIFYNPAALARRADSNLNLSVRGALDGQYLPFVSDVRNAAKQPTQDDKITAFTNLIEANYGRNYYERFPTVGAFWVAPHYGFAFVPADVETNVGIDRQIGPELNVTGFGDTTIAFSYARDIEHWIGKDQRLSIGMTVKAIHRLQISQSVSAAQLAVDSKIFNASEAQEGMTLDADIGTLYTPAVPSRGFFKFFKYMKPSFAFVVRNVVNEGFLVDYHFISKQSSKPNKLGRRFDVGTVYELPHFWVFEPRLAADLRDMGDPSWTLDKGYHLGAQFAWKMYNWWKGFWSIGLSQGYFTAGFGGKLAWFQLELATYGDQVGTALAPYESRRYMVEASLDF